MVKKYTVIDRIDAIVKWIILIIVGVFTAFPFLWMVVSAFKTKEEIMDTSKFLPQSLHWENFITLISYCIYSDYNRSFDCICNCVYEI